MSWSRRIRSWRLTLVVLALTSLVIAACGGGAETEDAPTAGIRSPGGEAAGDDGRDEDGETITLTIAEFEAEDSTRARIHKAWAEMLSERTDGRVEVEFFWSGSLVSLPDMGPGIAGGVADIGTLATSFDTTFVPLAGVPGGPGLMHDVETGHRATHEYFTTYEPVQQQFADENLTYLYAYAHPGDTYLGTQTPIESAADLRDITSRAVGGLWADAFTAAGLEMVSIPAGDVYTAVERGTVDAVLTWLLGFVDFRWYEQVENMTPMGTGTTASLAVVMNKDQFDGLPEDIQAAIRDVSDEIIDTSIEINTNDFEAGLQKIRDSGVVVADEPPGDLVEEMDAILDQIYEDYLTSVEGGQEAMAKLEEIIGEDLPRASSQ